MRKLLCIIALLLWASTAHAQATTVSATVVDPTGNPYVNGSFTAQFFDPGTSGKIPLVNGSTFQTVVAGSLDSFGHFSVVVTDNMVIATSSGATNTTWIFNICSQTYSTLNNQKFCFNWTAPAPPGITGPSVDISTQLKAVAATLPTNTGGGTTLNVNGIAIPNANLQNNSSCVWSVIGPNIQSTCTSPFLGGTVPNATTFSSFVTLNGGFTSTGPNTLNGTTTVGLTGNVSVKPQPGASIMYAAFYGSDSNDGLTLGTPKQYIDTAICSLPGGSCPLVTGQGKVIYANGTLANATSNVGIWLACSGDPLFASLPGGWMQGPVGSMGLEVEGIPTVNSGPQSTIPKALVGGNGNIKVSACSSSISFRNMSMAYPAIDIQLGQCSDGHTRTNQCNASNVHFYNVAGNVNNVPGNGPAVDMTGQSFDINYEDSSFEGNLAAAPSSDQAQPVLIDGRGNSGLGDITFNRGTLGNGGIRMYPGTGILLNVGVYDMVQEGSFGEALVHIVNPGLSTQPVVTVVNAQIADPAASTICATQVDNGLNGSGVTVIGSFGQGQNVCGPATVFGQYANNLANQTPSPLSQGQTGMFAGHLVGDIDPLWRMFAPVFPIYPNLASTNPSAWNPTYGGAISTITTGVADPTGQNGAGTCAYSSGVGNASYCSFYIAGNVPLTLGDYYEWSVIVWSATNNGYVSNNQPILFTLNGDGYGNGDQCNGSTNIQSLGNPLPYILGDGELERIWGYCKVTANPTPGGIVLYAQVSNTKSLSVFMPTLTHIPAGSVSANEAAARAAALQPYNTDCPVGSDCTMGPMFVNGGMTLNGNMTIAGCPSGTFVKADGTGCANGSGTTIQVNGSALASSSPVNFQNSAAFNGVTFTFTNTSLGNIQLGATGTFTNAALANSSLTINNQLINLGGSGNIPFQTNGANDTSLAGINFITSTTNAAGLTATPSNPGTNQVKFEITGTANLAANLAGCVGSTAGDVCIYNGTSWARLAGNTSGTQFLGENNLGVPAWGNPVGTGTVTVTNGGGNFTQYEPLVAGNAAQGAASVPAFFDAGLQTGATADVQVNACMTGTHTAGINLCDARDLSGAQTIAAQMTIGGVNGTSGIPESLILPSIGTWTTNNGFSGGTACAIFQYGLTDIDAITSSRLRMEIIGGTTGGGALALYCTDNLQGAPAGRPAYFGADHLTLVNNSGTMAGGAAMLIRAGADGSHWNYDDIVDSVDNAGVLITGGCCSMLMLGDVINMEQTGKVALDVESSSSSTINGLHIMSLSAGHPAPTFPIIKFNDTSSGHFSFASMTDTYEEGSNSDTVTAFNQITGQGGLNVQNMQIKSLVANSTACAWTISNAFNTAFDLTGLWMSPGSGTFTYPACGVNNSFTGHTANTDSHGFLGGYHSSLQYFENLTAWNFTLSGATGCLQAASGVVTGTGTNCGTGGVGTGTPNALAVWNGAGNGLNSVLGSVTGQVPVAQNGAPPVFISTGIAGSTIAAATPYLVQCDSTTTTLDRLRTLVFTAAAGVTVTIPDAGSIGCSSNFTTSIVGGPGVGTITVNRQTSSQFTIVTGTSALAGQTTFTLSAGQFATISSPDNANYLVRISEGGGGGGSIQLQTNSVNNSSQTGLNLINSAAFNGLTGTFTNTAGGTVQFGFSGSLGNGGLTNSSLTINGQLVSLGGSATIPEQINTTNLTSQAGFNILNSAATNGITLTVSNPGTNQIQLGYTGTLANSGLQNPSTTVNNVLCTLGATCINNPPFDKSTYGLSNPTQDSTWTQPAASTTGWTFAGTAPASSSGATGTNATSLININGVTGGADSNATGTAGVGSSPTFAAGNGGAGTGTNTVGGAGGNFTFTAGNGGASLGTGANANGGSIVFNMGTPGSGGSGTAGTPGLAKFNGTGAGAYGYAQGADNCATILTYLSTGLCEEAPVSGVSNYTVKKPAAIANGVITNNVASAIDTQGVSGDASHSTTVTIGSGTSIGSTSLCSTAICTAGTYDVSVYVDLTTPCGTSGTYIVNLIYTDDAGSKTVPVNLQGTGSVPLTGTLTTTSTSNFGQQVQVIRTTGAASINYSTTATACGTAGPMVGKLYLSATPKQ